MKFKSTRNSKISIDPKTALLKGISDDGGLFISEYIPQIDNIDSLIDLDYKELSNYILGLYFTDFTSEELSNCINGAYNDVNFSNPYIAPLKKLKDRYIVELYHGRTSAFKDMALSIFPYLIQTALKDSQEFEEVIILVATSGDTGKAALEGFKNIDNIKIAVLFPEEGVSSIQKLQMQTQEGNNTYVLGVIGNFDDCQQAVKDIFTNAELNKALNDKKIQLSSANSINIGRFLPQIIYYFSSYINLIKYGEIKDKEKINIVVPTGNFGNILAAYYAKEMGLPINNLICASNDNNVLTEFINTGIYNKNRDLILTTSPSMDVLVSSNVERFLYHISNGDTEMVSNLMNELSKKGIYELDDETKEKMDIIKGYYSTEEEINNKILSTFLDEGYLIDTHTAVASVAYDKYLKDTHDKTKTLIASTASPYKFSKDILEGLKINVDNLDDFEIMNRLFNITSMEIPENLVSLKSKEIRFRDFDSKENILSRLQDFMGEF